MRKVTLGERRPATQHGRPSCARLLAEPRIPRLYPCGVSKEEHTTAAGIRYEGGMRYEGPGSVRRGAPQPAPTSATETPPVGYARWRLCLSPIAYRLGEGAVQEDMQGGEDNAHGE